MRTRTGWTWEEARIWMKDAWNRARMIESILIV